MKHSILLCFSLLLTNCLFAQNIAKAKLNVENKSYLYYETKPATAVKGLLILLPGLGENVKTVFDKIKLPALLAQDGYVSIALQIPGALYADEECVSELNELLKLKLSQYNLNYNNVVLGGFSAGAAVVLCYAEGLNARATPVKLKAVFAVDPPADLARVYASAEKKATYPCGGLIKREGEQTIGNFNRIFGGPPASNADAYYRASAFTASAADGGNARYLKDVTLRLYSEPDLDYVRKTYCTDLQLSDINAYDLEKLITFLNNAGNSKANYVKTTGRGFHSWNIVDPENCR